MSHLLISTCRTKCYVPKRHSLVSKTDTEINRKESRAYRSPHTYMDSPFATRKARGSVEKGEPQEEKVLEKCTAICDTMRVDHDVTSGSHTTSKWIKALNGRLETVDRKSTR